MVKTQKCINWQFDKYIFYMYYFGGRLVELKQIVNLDVEITKENSYLVQELILRLTMVGAVKQEDARALFIVAERMNGIEYR